MTVSVIVQVYLNECTTGNRRIETSARTPDKSADKQLSSPMRGCDRERIECYEIYASQERSSFDRRVSPRVSVNPGAPVIITPRVFTAPSRR